ncbi:MAG: hypothetical protein AAFY76_10940 [Cyanobacteria bacterium J06649_11]
MSAKNQRSYRKKSLSRAFKSLGRFGRPDLTVLIVYKADDAVYLNKDESNIVVDLEMAAGFKGVLNRTGNVKITEYWNTSIKNLSKRNIMSAFRKRYLHSNVSYNRRHGAYTIDKT